MIRAIELLKNSFGVSQLYQHDVIKDGNIIFSVYWHPLTISERESISKKSNPANASNSDVISLSKLCLLYTSPSPETREDRVRRGLV